MPTTALREFVRTYAENRPGIYQMLGKDGTPLYVGKSVHVRSRLLSYFTAPRGEKASKLIREAVHIRWEYVPNEFAALVSVIPPPQGTSTGVKAILLFVIAAGTAAAVWFSGLL